MSTPRICETASQVLVTEEGLHAARQARLTEEAWQAWTTDAVHFVQSDHPDAHRASKTLATFVCEPLQPSTPLRIMEALQPFTDSCQMRSPLRESLQSDIILHNQQPKALERADLTYDQREQLGRPYRFGREAMILALRAELSHEVTEATTHADGLMIHTLPSGIQLALRASALEGAPSLLQPTQWEKYRQKVDRVYQLRTTDGTFICKERKTPYHISIVEGKHVDGLTSQKEFETALHFASQPPLTQNDITVRFEEPVGYATFPNGYQFTMFEQAGFEPNTTNILRQSIERSPEKYHKAFTGAQHALADELEQPLTYKDFASAKALVRVFEAQMALGRTIFEQGYVNTDHNDFVLRPQGKALDIIGIDFEYFRHMPQEAADKLSDREHMYDENLAEQMSHTLKNVSKNVRATAYYLLEVLGW